MTTIDSVIKNLLKNIDYDVPKIVGTKGDSESGYRRWQQFLKHGLKRYDKRRNNVLFHYSYGVSRMSCYLNLGIVSPFKIVRTILESKIKNEKFLSEFLCWRELELLFLLLQPKLFSFESCFFQHGRTIRLSILLTSDLECIHWSN